MVDRGPNKFYLTGMQKIWLSLLTSTSPRVLDADRSISHLIRSHLQLAEVVGEAEVSKEIV